LELEQFGKLHIYPLDLCDDEQVPARKAAPHIQSPVMGLDMALTKEKEIVEVSGSAPKSDDLAMSAKDKIVNRERIRRIMREMKALHVKPHPAFDIFPCVEDISFWKATMEGPASTPYKDGVWLLYVAFPSNYPDSAPEIRFITPIKHCNVNCYGRICHSIFDRNYTPDTTMATIFQCIFGLLLSPDVSDPLDSTLAFEFYDDSGLYETSIVEQTRKHAGKKTREQWKLELSPAPEKEKEKMNQDNKNVSGKEKPTSPTGKQDNKDTQSSGVTKKSQSKTSEQAAKTKKLGFIKRRLTRRNEKNDKTKKKIIKQKNPIKMKQKTKQNNKTKKQKIL